MAAPTLTSQTGSTWNDATGTTETTGTLTWNSADLVLVVGFTEDSSLTLTTPTATGLTFAALGSAQATASSCWVHAWTATAASPGSTTVGSTHSSGATAGIHAYAFGGCTGFVRTSGATLNATQTVSVTRTQNNSFMVFISADWSASGTAGLAWTPAGQTQVQAASNANAAAFCAYWGDQGSAGTTSYGTSGLSGTKYTVAAIEILGTVGGPAFVATPPYVIRQAVKRASIY